jgi:hypothetical protein
MFLTSRQSSPVYCPQCLTANGGPAGTSAAPPQIAETVRQLAPPYGIAPGLVTAVESSFRSDATSPKGGVGLMHLMPATAARFRVTDPFQLHGELRTPSSPPAGSSPVDFISRSILCLPR